MSWLWIYKIGWNKPSNSWIFCDVQSKVGIGVVRYFGSFEVMMMLLVELAELLLVANCWWVNKIWSASIVAGVFSLQNYGSFVGLAFFCCLEEVRRDQKEFFYWTPVTMWEVSSRSESVKLLVRQTEISTSGYESFTESSPVASQFSESLFRDVPGTATEQVRTCGFRRNPSNLNKAPRRRDSVRLKSWE